MHRLRSYIAGIGSSSAILSAIAIAFLALGGIVATDGLPIGSAESGGAAVEVDSSAPEAAAAAAAIAALAPAADPATPAPGVVAPATAGGGPAGLGAPAGGGGEGGAPIVPTDPGPGGPPVTTPPTTPPPVPLPAPTGDVAGLVDEVDGTVAEATGVGLRLQQVAKPATGFLDTAVQSLSGGRPLGLGDVDIPLGR